MAANSEESLEERKDDELLGTKRPVAPRSLTMEDASEDENENSGDILDEQDDEERNTLLELKKCKDWLQQQKINHEAELLVRKLLILTHELLIVMDRESYSSEKSVKIVQFLFFTRGATIYFYAILHVSFDSVAPLAGERGNLSFFLRLFILHFVPTAF